MTTIEDTCKHIFEFFDTREESIGEYKDIFKCRKCKKTYEEYSTALKARQYARTNKNE